MLNTRASGCGSSPASQADRPRWPARDLPDSPSSISSIRHKGRMSRAVVGRGFCRADPRNSIQRELGERDTIGASSRFLIRLCTHEIADKGYIWIGVVLGQLIHSFGVGNVIGVHPGVRGVVADELEAKRDHTASACIFDRLQL